MQKQPQPEALHQEAWKAGRKPVDTEAQITMSNDCCSRICVCMTTSS